jgi:hypothetical protein
VQATAHHQLYHDGDPGVETKRGDPVDAGTRRALSDWVWPRLHPRWWFREAATAKELRDIFFEPIKNSAEFLADVVESTKPAAERVAAAERRAGTLAGAVAIAASLTTSGAGLVLDTDKIAQTSWQITFAALMAATTLFLVLSGLYAARTIVGWRRWTWPNPWKAVTQRGTEDADEIRIARAAELLRAFSYNWEVADVKLRALDSAFRCFVFALGLFVVLSAAVVAYVADPSVLPW